MSKILFFLSEPTVPDYTDIYMYVCIYTVPEPTVADFVFLASGYPEVSPEGDHQQPAEGMERVMTPLPWSYLQF